jgi:hypothetical protein
MTYLPASVSWGFALSLTGVAWLGLLARRSARRTRPREQHTAEVKAAA